MKLTMMLLSILLITSCQTGAEQALVCNQIAEHQIVPLVRCSVRMKLNKCRCRCFDYNSWSTLKLNECIDFSDQPAERIAIDFPLSFCEDVEGSWISDNANFLRPQVKALFRIKENLCQ